jgi:hypothetical protein
METVTTGNWMHDFIAAKRGDRPDLATIGELIAVREWTFSLSDDVRSFIRHGHRFEIAPGQASVIQAIDEGRTVDQIAAYVGVPPDYARQCIKSLWRLGCLALKRP